MKKILFAFIAALLPTGYAHAVCPICTVAVGTGVGFAEWLGIDDVLIGIWIGALLVSMSEWLITYLERKNWKFKYYKLVVYLVMYVSTFIPLYTGNFIWNPLALNMIWGIDKLFLGIIIGSIVFVLGAIEYKRYKSVHGHAMFPFQKVVWPVLPVVIATLVFWLFIL